MPYLGKEPVRGQNRELDDISGSFNGGNTAFTMQVGGVNTSAGSVNQLFISVGGVMQNPGTDFTVASSTITFTTPPASGLDFWGLIQGDAVDINTPADASVSTAKIIDNAVGLAQMASGTDGNLITYDASGDPAHVATGSSGQVLTSNGAGAAPTFQASSKSFRNLIINGAMQVAQRGTSSTSSDFGLDRWKVQWSGQDEALTHAQHALTSSDTGPWAKGFRNSLHITNGNQTSGAGAADYAEIRYVPEAQDLACSGWDSTSSSSKLTLSFWVKSSVAQNFYVWIYNGGGTKNYVFETGSLSADTWTKVTKTIPGASGVTVANDNTGGLTMYFSMFEGTDRTASMSLDTWATYSSSSRTPDMTSTWWTTNDATFEITGVQLEVGDTATDFEHRSYGDELRRCHRYFYRHVLGSWNTNGKSSITDNASMYNATLCFLTVPLPVTMRTEPTLGTSNSSDYYEAYVNGASVTFDTWGLDGVSTKRCLTINATLPSVTAGASALVRTDNAAAYLDAIAEL